MVILGEVPRGLRAGTILPSLGPKSTGPRAKVMPCGTTTSVRGASAGAITTTVTEGQKATGLPKGRRQTEEDRHVGALQGSVPLCTFVTHGDSREGPSLNCVCKQTRRGRCFYSLQHQNLVHNLQPQRSSHAGIAVTVQRGDGAAGPRRARFRLGLPDAPSVCTDSEPTQEVAKEEGPGPPPLPASSKHWLWEKWTELMVSAFVSFQIQPLQAFGE